MTNIVIPIIFRALKSDKGNVALGFGLIVPFLLGFVGLAADYALVFNQESRLQQAADNAALAGARELGIAGNDDEEVKEVTKTYAYSSFFDGPPSETEQKDLIVDTSISETNSGLTVELNYFWKPFFAHYIDSDVLPIKVKATAGLAGETSICTLALDRSADGSISILGNSLLQARECSVQSNSSSSSAIAVEEAAKLIAGATCTAGGYIGAAYSYRPTPVTDCPNLDDPLHDRVLPSSSGGCDHNYLMIFRTKRTLSPGKYCGGLVILNNSEVTLEPGTYVFTNGDLDMGEQSTLLGDGVNLHFAENARMIIRNNSSANLTAPRSGAMAGIVVSSGRSNDPDLTFEVESRDARVFTGLIYLPNHTLKLGDDMDGDGRCDVDNDEYRVYHPRGHSHEHIHEDGTIHTHGHFMTGTYPWNSDGIKEHPSQTSHVHDEIIEENPNCIANVGEKADWTAIVARNILMTSGVNLVLNADYEDSPVPVPINEGLIGQHVSLSE